MKFNAKGAIQLEGLDITPNLTLNEVYEDSDADEDYVASEFSDAGSGNNEEDDMDFDAEDISPEFPEKLQLILPSSFDRKDIVVTWLQDLSSQELQLHKGQANDCLEKLCLTLGHQSMLYHTKIRQASGTKE